MPQMVKKILARLKIISTLVQRKNTDVKLIYERIPDTDREIMIRAVHPDGTEIKTIVKVFPPGFRSMKE